MKRILAAAAAVSATVWTGFAQELVRCGAGSFASYTPWEKARTFGPDGKRARNGDQSRIMQNRTLWVVEKEGRPLPTNDWWTDLMMQRYSGNLWAYPALVRASAAGVTVQFPSYWIENGTEMKARSSVTVGGAGFAPESAVATDWHDWDFSFEMRDPSSGGTLRTTLAHGMPYVWIETSGVDVKVTADPGAGATEVLAKKGAHEVWKVGDDLYGITRGEGYVVVSLIPAKEAASEILRHAAAIPRETRVDWRYDPAAGCVETVWNVVTEDLRTKAANAEALQGFLPHHFRGTDVKFDFAPGLVYATPRGELRLAKGNCLAIRYPFHGMVPYWPMPQGAGTTFRPEVLDTLVKDYAAKGSYGGDTYWGGKGLLQMAFAMLAARERGDEATYRAAHDSLRAAFENWFTWTPGERNRYFSYVPRWGGLVGEDTSYDSDTFNDHHFHYGYFTYSGALLCLVDSDFRTKFGPMLRLLVRDYANPRRDDPKFPFFRTFDPWAGHSFAGGVGDGAGNGQESSSEAMQGWGGVFWLGVALGDDALRDAGLFGYVSEARGTAEYWFDRARRNIDYAKYKHPYCSNLTCHGVGWWTYFSGDPVWMHAIQWMPSTPVLDYLSEDRKFAAWDYATMWEKKQITGWDGELGKASLGNVLLSYWQRSDPKAAGAKFDELWDLGKPVAHNPDTAHMTYWQIQAHLRFGDIDNAVYADVPWARAYANARVAYNPGTEAKTVTFRDRQGRTVGTLEALPQRLTVSGQASRACGLVAPPKASAASADLVPDGVVLPDLARGRPVTVSSEENAGLKGVNLTDGDEKTRWGSAHSDAAMTATVDLGETAALYGVRLNWEASHASKYVLEGSVDGRAWTALGGERTGRAGEQRLALAGEKARFVRMRALEKNSQYGVSLWSFNVYGKPGSYTGSVPLGLKITAPRAVLKEGEPTRLAVARWYPDKRGLVAGTDPGKAGSVPIAWSSSGGKIDENGNFTPTKAGSVPVQATLGGLTVEEVFLVEEALKPTRLEVTPRRGEALVGDGLKLAVAATDQFGGRMPLKGVKVAIDGPAGAKFEKGAFVAPKAGDYTVTFTLGALRASAQVKVATLAEINLARLGTVSASGEENPGLAASNAVDGDAKTRWGSAHRDGEWIAFDLGRRRTVSRADIHWENARADHYRIEVSEDGAAWRTVLDVPHAKGGRESVSWKPVEARCVRLTGLTRNTPYGISIFEFELH